MIVAGTVVGVVVVVVAVITVAVIAVAFIVVGLRCWLIDEDHAGAWVVVVSSLLMAIS